MPRVAFTIMARQLRILYSGAWYHVMNRGVDHQPIFFKSKHRKLFTKILEKISDVYKLEVHAYCLMTNHYHVLLRTLEPNLPSAIQYLDGVYAQKLNKDMSRDGPLLRGRFKSILVEQDEYLLHVSRYIHLNPLEAGIVEDLDHYRWSSYPYYTGDKNKPKWLHLDFIHDYFKGDDVPQLYKKYTLAGNDASINEFYSTENVKPVLATKEFIKNLNIEPSESSKEIDLKFVEMKVSLNVILNVVEKISGASKEKITRSARGQKNTLRCLFIYLSRNITGYKINDIAKFLSDCHYSTVSASLSRFEKRIASSQELRSLVALCKMELFSIVKSYH